MLARAAFCALPKLSGRRASRQYKHAYGVSNKGLMFLGQKGKGIIRHV